MGNDLINKYRKKFGCTNSGVCWCEVCCNIEKLIEEVKEKIKLKINEL